MRFPGFGRISRLYRVDLYRTSKNQRNLYLEMTLVFIIFIAYVLRKVIRQSVCFGHIDDVELSIVCPIRFSIGVHDKDIYLEGVQWIH